MKKVLLLLAAVICSMVITAQVPKDGGYPTSPVPFTSVNISGNSFWGQRLNASREVTIPLAFSKCKESGRYENFSKAALHNYNENNLYRVGGLPFDDTDVYKTIEGASYLLQTYPDKKLEAYIDSVLAVVSNAQEPDGYLYTARTMNPNHPHSWSGPKRWSQVESGSHEFYNLGHMIEGAIAHYQATGKRNFLDIAIKYADCVCREIGEGPGQIVRVPGHQIAEMALSKLYLVTGDVKYLNMAKFFLDRRGYTQIKDEYSQAHKPVIEQDEAVGHAVRAAYMYSGMADVAALTGNNDYIAAIDRIWDNIVGKKLYVTGGIGATSNGEAFGKNYELPNMSAYCETCAAIGNVYFNYRMFLLHGESKYIDVLERSLYNGLISGVSLDGGSFFYPNPLESAGQHQRQAWFGCACCPSNICRFIPSLPGYVYAVRDDNFYINLFAANTVSQEIGGKEVVLTQDTDYPWSGDIRIRIDKNACKDPFNLKIRIPGWARNRVVPSDLYSYCDGEQPEFTISVNGSAGQGTLTDDGYYTITRKWKKGDVVEVCFEMIPRTVKAHEKVEADAGRIAIERGPVVYCAEWPDNDFSVRNAVLDENPSFTVEYSDDLYGIEKIRTRARAVVNEEDGGQTVRDVEMTLIPYYAWCHRGSGEMTVWIPIQKRSTIDIDAGSPGTPVQKTMYGLFFEDINYAADGGLYAELVKNRSFEFDNPLMGWNTFGKVDVRNDGPFERCPHYVRLSWSGHQSMVTGLENEGYFGMGIERGKQYRITVWARTAPYGKNRKAAESEFITFHLCDDDTMGENQMFTSNTIEVKGREWKKYEVVFTAPRSVQDATLRIILETRSRDWQGDRTDCCVDLEHISLFPVDTYNGDPNGLRRDIAEALAELKPGVLRFPGGCIVEGSTLEQRYQWKNSVGPVENRPVNMNRWNYTFPERMYPDYYQSYGLGFYEFFRFAEEIGAEPLPVISCGMACQFQNNEADNPHAPVDKLQPYIDDALDLIEFANGPVTSKWGKVRAEMGHPEPFNLKYLAIGNEQWGEVFIDHLKPFISQIRTRYPDLKLIGSAGPSSGGEDFDYLWPKMRELGCDLVDEHFYSPESFFENNATRYDNYPREGTKVFAGEYACHGSNGRKFNHFNAALMEAAFMTGLERNADVVYMATYAPLLAHIKGWQWRPDLIWFDNLRVMRSASYYVQQLYSQNKGDNVLPALMNGKPVTGQSQLYASSVMQDDEIIVKVANLNEGMHEVTLSFGNLTGQITEGTVTSIHASDPMAENTLDNPDIVKPYTYPLNLDSEEEGTVGLKKTGRTTAYVTSVTGKTFTVFRFKVKK